MKELFLIFFLVFANSEVAGDALLRLKVNTQKATEYYPMSQCGDSDSCVPWRYWYVYEAEVTNVLSGSFSGTNVTFANIQHAAYVDEYLSDVFVAIKEIPNEELKNQLGVSFYISGFEHSKNLVCFNNKVLEEMESDVAFQEALYIKDDNQSCFVKELLDDE